MIYVIVLILLLLVALFVLLRYERFAHRDPNSHETMYDERTKKQIPIRHGALDESLFIGIKRGLADDWQRLKRRF